MKTTTALMAVAFAALALAPVAQADLNTTSVLYVGDYQDTGIRGAGVYDPDVDSDPTTADNYCFALLSQWSYLAVGFNYYGSLRLFPQAANAVVTSAAIDALRIPLKGVPLLEDCFFAIFGGVPSGCDPTQPITGVNPCIIAPADGAEDCNSAGTGPSFPDDPRVPNDVPHIDDECQWIYNDGFNLGFGTAFFIDAGLAATEVADLATVDAGLEYCTVLSIPSTAGSRGDLLGTFTTLGDLGLIGTGDIECGANGGYDLDASCALLTYSTTLGSVAVDTPIMLSSTTATTLNGDMCNSQVGNPAASAGGLTNQGGFVTEVCMRVDAFDSATGITAPFEDTDWFLNVGAGTSVGDLQWLLVGSNLPARISNLPELSGAGPSFTFPGVDSPGDSSTC
jgi:hypothetical protein